MNSSDPRTDSLSEPATIDLRQIQRRAADLQRFQWFTTLGTEVLAEVSAAGEVEYVSANVQAILGFAPPELIGGHALAKVHPQDLRCARALRSRRCGDVTVRHRHKNGSWRWVEVTTRFVPETAGYAVVLRDITARKLIEEERDIARREMERMSKLAALGTVAGGVVHDFNNLLTAIMAYSGQARADTRSPEVASALDQVLKASERARQLTRQILAFSREETHAPKPVRLTPIVQEAIALLRPMIPPNVELCTEISGADDLVQADACQIHQVVLNLCSNAVHAMRPNPGRVTLALRRCDPPVGHDRLWQPAESICLSVSDTGSGMDAATRDRIFEPFFTTKPKGEGTGLGLAVVQRIVRDHGARIAVASEPGLGTTFSLYFPLLKASAAPERPRI